MHCLYCGKRLSLLHKLAGREYCNDEHRSLFMQDQESLGLARLIDAKNAAQHSSHEKRTRETQRKSSTDGIPALADRFYPESPRPLSVVNPCFAPGEPIPTIIQTSCPQPEPRLATTKLPLGPRGTLTDEPTVPDEMARTESAPVALFGPLIQLPKPPESTHQNPDPPDSRGFLLPTLNAAVGEETPHLHKPGALAPSLATAMARPNLCPGVAMRTASEVAVNLAPVSGVMRAVSLPALDFNRQTRFPAAAQRIEGFLVTDPDRLAELDNCVPGFVAPPVCSLDLRSGLRTPNPAEIAVFTTPSLFPEVPTGSGRQLRTARFIAAPAKPLSGRSEVSRPPAEAGSIEPEIALPRVTVPPLGGSLPSAAFTAVPAREPECAGLEPASIPEIRANDLPSAGLTVSPDAVSGPMAAVPRFDQALISEWLAPDRPKLPVVEPQPVALNLPAEALALPPTRTDGLQPPQLPRAAGCLPIECEPSSGGSTATEHSVAHQPVDFSAPALAPVEMAGSDGPRKLSLCPRFLPVGPGAAADPPAGAAWARRETLPPEPLPMTAAAIPSEPVLEEASAGGGASGPQFVMRERPGLLRMTLDRMAPVSQSRAGSVELAPMEPSFRPMTPRFGLSPAIQERFLPGGREGDDTRARQWKQAVATLSGYWRRVPTRAVWCITAVPVLAVLLSQIPWTVAENSAEVAEEEASSEMTSRWQTFQANIVQRAAVALADDFRGGLGDWTGDGNWARSWSYDTAGFVRPGKLAFYEPSMALTDYRFRFAGQIEKLGLSWIFRAADSKNYYVGRLVITEPGPIPKGAVIRYPVVNGRRGKLTRSDLPFRLRNEKMYEIQVDVRGDSFTTYVDGRLADFFKDDRLPRGGVGFFRGSGEKSRLRWVSVMHQYDILGRLCALIAPHNLESASRSMQR